MSTSTHAEEEIDEMYEELDRIIDAEKEKDNVIILVDRNLAVVEGIEGKIVGLFGWRQRNARGEKIIEFCRQKTSWLQTHDSNTTREEDTRGQTLEITKDYSYTTFQST